MLVGMGLTIKYILKGGLIVKPIPTNTKVTTLFSFIFPFFSFFFFFSPFSFFCSTLIVKYSRSALSNDHDALFILPIYFNFSPFYLSYRPIPAFIQMKWFNFYWLDSPLQWLCKSFKLDINFILHWLRLDFRLPIPRWNFFICTNYIFSSVW